MNIDVSKSYSAVNSSSLAPELPIILNWALLSLFADE